MNETESKLRADHDDAIPQPQQRLYNTATVLNLARNAGYGQERKGFSVNLLPKLRQLGIGTCFGGKGEPIYYTERETRILLLWMVYRSYMVDTGRNHVGKHFTVKELEDFIATPYGAMGRQDGDYVFNIVDAIMKEADAE